MTKVSSFEADIDREMTYKASSSSSSTAATYFSLHLSRTTRDVKVKYYTVLDAFSYVGGLFNSIFAFFFLLKWYAATLPDF